MNLVESNFKKFIGCLFQHLNESDIDNLKCWIESKDLNENVKTNFKKSFKNFKKDITSLKKLVDDEKLFRRIYAYSWELILLYASLEVVDFKVENFSFKYNYKEKDLLIEFNSIKYHIEVTSKSDIGRSQVEKDKLVKNGISRIQELSSKNLTDNSNFDYNVLKKFDIPNTYKVLFIYQMKSSFFDLKDYIKSIKNVVEPFNIKYILYNNLSSTVGRSLEENPNTEVKARHNFESNDLFLNKLMNSIIFTLDKLKSDNKNDNL